MYETKPGRFEWSTSRVLQYRVIMAYALSFVSRVMGIIRIVRNTHDIICIIVKSLYYIQYYYLIRPQNEDHANQVEPRYNYRTLEIR